MARKKSAVAVRVRPVPIPKALARAQLAGEFVAAVGGSQQDIAVAQTGVQRRLLSKIIVLGLGADGRVRDKVELTLDSDFDGDIELDLDNGNRSAIEALEPGLARAVVYHAARMKKRGLTADVRFVYTDEVAADPDRLAAARAELGTAPAEMPAWKDGHAAREVLRIRPKRDPGLLISLFEDFPED